MALMTPILLCVQGRSGGTAMMKLLASSGAVFCDRDYPYESKRYLTYFAKLAELLARGEPPDPFNESAMVEFNNCVFGGFPWTYSQAYEGTNWPPDRVDWLRVFWQGFSRLAARSNPEARYYSEKAPAWLPGIVRQAVPAEVMYVFRDLRDVYLSTQKWGRTDAEYLERQKAGETGEIAHMLAYEFMQNYEHYVADRAAGDAFMVRYEDSIRDAPGTISRIEERFRLRLNLKRSREEWSRHATSPSLEASVERWRTEGLDERAHRALRMCAGHEMRDLGYEVGDLPAPFFELSYSREDMPAQSIHESPDGRLHLESGRARVEIQGARYWLTLPVKDFDAEALDHIWVCVAEGPGNVCAIDWAADGPSTEAACFHVEYQPSANWRVLDFPVKRHAEWRGKIREMRLHLFNLYQEGFGRRLSLATACQGTGYLRWIRGFKLD